MKKLLSLILTLTLILPCISAFVLEASAEDKYAELWKQREEYLKAKYEGYAEYLEKADSEEKIEVPVGMGGNHTFTLFVATQLTVLLYTDIAKDLTFEIHRVYQSDDEIQADNPRGFNVFQTMFDFKSGDYEDNFWISSPEIDKVIETCKDFRYEKKSMLRECIKYFDISKEELKTANKLMQENPESVRNLFPTLTDKDFENAKNEYGLYCREPLEDFMIEALYLKDDAIANNLLCYTSTVYVKELDCVIGIPDGYYSNDFFVKDYDEYHKYDLTPQYMGDFINLCYHLSGNRSFIYEDNVLRMKAEREYQLANPKPPSTGEALYLIPVALVSLALGALVIYPRRRKIDNI